MGSQPHTFTSQSTCRRKKTGHGVREEQRIWTSTRTPFSYPGNLAQQLVLPTSQGGWGKKDGAERPLWTVGLFSLGPQARAHPEPSEGARRPAGPASAAGTTCGSGSSPVHYSAGAPPSHNSSTSLPPGSLPINSVLTASGCQGPSCCPSAWHSTHCSWQGPIPRLGAVRLVGAWAVSGQSETLLCLP